MSSKNLIISFVTVSVAALIVSAFAVFTVARRYAAELTDSGTGESITAPESAEDPITGCAVTESASTAETEEEASEELPAEDITASASEEITETETVTTASEYFTLSLLDDRLVISDPSGEVVYERIINASRLREADRKALLSGIEFPDAGSAMSAVYDIIS